MRALLVAAVMLAAIFSGCSSPSKPADLVVHSQPGNPTIQTTTTVGASEATSGAVEGLIVDAAIHPLPAATVRIPGLNRETLSANSGHFKLPNVPPGAYYVTATLEGYEMAHVVVQVGDAAVDLRFVLSALPSHAPRHVTQHFAGLADITASDAGNADNTTVFPSQSNHDISFDIDAGATALLLEAAMDPCTYGSPCTNGFAYDFREAGRMQHGDNPVRHEVDSTEYKGTNVRVYVMPTSTPVSELNKEYDVYLTTWYYEQPTPGWSFLKGDI